jgi:hypothetical protein
MLCKVGRVSMIVLKNGPIVAVVSIPRIFDDLGIPSRYGKRGYNGVRLALFSRILHTRRSSFLKVYDNAQ